MTQRSARSPARSAGAHGRLPRVDEFVTHKIHLLAKLADRGAAQIYGPRYGLSLREWRVLAVIGCFAPLSLGRVAELANLDRGHGSRAVDSLVARGYVSRTQSAADRRGWTVELTAEGRTCFDAVYPEGVERNRRLIACLSADEYRCLIGALDRMTEVARAMNAELDAEQPQ